MRTAVPAGAATALLAIAPAALAAREADDPPSPQRLALSADVAGHVTVAAQMRAARRDAQERRLRRRVTRLERRVARVRGERPERLPLRGESPTDLRARVTAVRRELKRARAFERVAIPPQLAAIAACESGGDPGAIGGGGLYRGKYQFDVQTWASVGGSGDPAAAPEAEQDMRAALLYQRAGAAPWPVCGR